MHRIRTGARGALAPLSLDLDKLEGQQVEGFSKVRGHCAQGAKRLAESGFDDLAGGGLHLASPSLMILYRTSLRFAQEKSKARR
jgi:hypothetical protein